jgi:opacity protein-like surface antigen
MKSNRYGLQFAAGLFLAFLLNTAQAWNHEVSIGYGWGQEIGANYDNHAIVLSGSFYKFKKIDNTLFITLDGTLANLMANTPRNNSLTTAGISLAFRAYFQNPDFHKIRPHVGISAGATYLSQNQLGTQVQGSKFDFQWTIGGGIEFALPQNQGIDVTLNFLHYCNAGLAKPNEGFDIPFLLALGYQF